MIVSSFGEDSIRLPTRSQRLSAAASVAIVARNMLQQAWKQTEGAMTTQTIQLPWQGTMAGFRRFSVAEYHKLIEIGILTEDDNLELLEGYLVHKMSRNPPHDATIQKA